MDWLVCILLLWLVVTSEGDGEKLIQTTILYRHGDRSPISIYPNDPHQQSEWQVPLGQLTKKGKEQHLHLGKFLRGRYKHLLDTIFKPKQIYVLSSGMDRTLMSAYSNLAGLYANGSIEWKSSYITWQPIPVHTLPFDADDLLRNSRKCKRVDKESQRLKDTGDLLKIRNDFKGLWEVLQEKTGYKEPITVDKIDQIRDTLFCEKAHDMPWPSWVNYTNITCPTNSLIPCKDRSVFDILTDIQDEMVVVLGKSDVISKFRGGPLALEIIGNMNKKVSAQDNETSYNVVMYSAHDSTVAALLNALKMYNGKFPQYTATLMIELYEVTGRDDPVVKIFYKNITDNPTIYDLTIPNCGKACPLSKFTALYKDLTVHNWDEECGNIAPSPPEGTSLSQGEITVIVICALLVTVLTFVALICRFRQKRPDPHQYSLVPT